MIVTDYGSGQEEYNGGKTERYLYLARTGGFQYGSSPAGEKNGVSVWGFRVRKDRICEAVSVDQGL